MNLHEFLNALINYEKIPGYNYDLDAYKKFLEKLGSPHKKLKNVILIAGTKGKGSTAAIINSCLVANGYKVGLYTSPHLKRINERIKINNQEVSSQEIKKYIRVIKPQINFKTRIGARTFFEVLTTIAFLHFLKNNVDFTILEVGLGGRLDATNVTEPLFSIITRVGYDHTNLLGNKLSQIAYEKAGIIADNRWPMTDRQQHVLITIHQRQSVESVLKKIARERHNEIIYADDLHQIKIKRMTLFGTDIQIDGPLKEFRTSLPLIGRHQIENLLLALTALNVLKEMGFGIKLLALKKGVANTELHGRFEVISKKPLIIFDVAHNEDSFRALDDNLELLCLAKNLMRFPFYKKKKRGFYLVFGCNKDKDINYAIKNIFPKAKKVLLVKANNRRAMEPIEIYSKARRYQRNILIAGSVKKAIEYLKSKTENNSAIIITGSFYLWNEL